MTPPCTAGRYIRKSGSQDAYDHRPLLRFRVWNGIPGLDDFWIELFEAVGAVLEETHTAEEARIVAQNTGAHTAVIEDLLSGTDAAGAEGHHLLTLCGMRPVKKMAVALIRPSPPDDGKHVDTEVSRRYPRTFSGTSFLMMSLRLLEKHLGDGTQV